MVIRIVKFLLLAYFVAFCQTVLSDLMAILGIAPDLGSIIIFLIVVRREFPVGFPAVFMVGLIIDALNPQTLGLGTVVRFAIAIAVYEIRQHLNIDRLSARLYLLLGAEMCFQLIYQMAANSFDFGIVNTIYFDVSLPTLAYTMALGFVVLVISDLEFKIEIRRRANG